MSKRSLSLLLFASLAAPAAAFADSYSFMISTGASSHGAPGSTFLASGTLTGTVDGGTSSPALDLTGVTGSAQGYAFTGVVPLHTINSFAYDNLLFTDASATHVDANGILLYLNSPVGTSLAHVYDNGGYHVDVFDPNDPGDITPFAIDSFTLTPSSVPEPATLALLGTGAIGLVGSLRRRLSR